jgi:hypothetical protein
MSTYYAFEKLFGMGNVPFAYITIYIRGAW